MSADNTIPCRVNKPKNTATLSMLLAGTLILVYLLVGEPHRLTANGIADICHADRWQRLPSPLYFFFTEGCGARP